MHGFYYRLLQRHSRSSGSLDTIDERTVIHQMFAPFDDFLILPLVDVEELDFHLEPILIAERVEQA